MHYLVICEQTTERNIMFHLSSVEGQAMLYSTSSVEAERIKCLQSNITTWRMHDIALEFSQSQC
jgi:hypothetical protein